MPKPWRSEIGVPNVPWGGRGFGSYRTRVTPGALRKLGPPSLARSSKKKLDPWSLGAWKLGDLRAWRFGCLEAWTELGGLDAWKLGDFESHSRMPRRGRRMTGSASQAMDVVSYFAFRREDIGRGVQGEGGQNYWSLAGGWRILDHRYSWLHNVISLGENRYPGFRRRTPGNNE